MRNEKISLELFAIISKKYSLVEIDGHGEGENVACEKRTSLAKGRKKPANGEKEACKQGERYLEIGRKVRFGSLPPPVLTN